jgi:Bifunctional DNA primase/polymerase, N-terminal/Primase C terminal 1 (PriCT-1)
MSERAAVAYAVRGLPVFPVRLDARDKKRPHTTHGHLDATTDARTIHNWFGPQGLWPDAAIGVRTGSGLVVIDVDPRHGGDEGFDELCDSLGAPPRTATVATAQGGRHLWFRVPPSERVPNSAGTLARGVDVRGDGGWVVAPPSSAPWGTWSWSTRAPIADLPPEWLRATALARPSQRREPARTWVGLVAQGAGAGERNASLTRLVGHLLARDVAPALVLEVAQLINQHRFRPPLDNREVERVVESIAGRELRKRSAA